MAGTDKRQQEAMDAARRLAEQQIRTQEMARQRQETAKRAAIEAAQLRQAAMTRTGNSKRRATSSKSSPGTNTEDIERRLVKDVEDIMHQESFGDLVYVGTKSASGRRESGSSRRESIRRNSATVRRAGYARFEEEDKEWDDDLSSEALRHWGKVGQWFQMFCWMHIPIFGFWYMVVTALRKKNPEEKRAFAKAFIIYRLLVLILAFTLLYVLYRMGLDFIEQILSYVDLHS